MRRMALSKSAATAGEPKASMTTTPAGVTTTPALEMKLRFSGVPRAASPCANQMFGATGCKVSGAAHALSPDRSQNAETRIHFIARRPLR